MHPSPKPPTRKTEFGGSENNIKTIYIHGVEGLNIDNFQTENLEYIRIENSGLIGIQINKDLLRLKKYIYRK